MTRLSAAERTVPLFDAVDSLHPAPEGEDDGGAQQVAALADSSAEAEGLRDAGVQLALPWDLPVDEGSSPA
jgi:hypothetical protein